MQERFRDDRDGFVCFEASEHRNSVMGYRAWPCSTKLCEILMMRCDFRNGQGEELTVFGHSLTSWKTTNPTRHPGSAIMCPLRHEEGLRDNLRSIIPIASCIWTSSQIKHESKSECFALLWSSQVRNLRRKQIESLPSPQVLAAVTTLGCFLPVSVNTPLYPALRVICAMCPILHFVAIAFAFAYHALD